MAVLLHFDGADLVLRYLGYRVAGGVVQAVGGAFREVEVHQDYACRKTSVTSAFATTISSGIAQQRREELKQLSRGILIT